eukprot:UN06069
MTTSNKSSPDPCQMKQSDDLKQYIILLDWDDTMFPSSYLLENIDFCMDTNSGKIKAFHVAKNKEEEFVSNLQNVGHSALQLLNKLLFHFESSQIKIVTNSANGWVFDALSIAATFCSTYNKIKHLLINNKIEIMYARKYDLQQCFWKIKCFNLLLSQFNLEERSNIIISIGDQWADHTSLRQCLLFCTFKKNIFHHQIKFLEAPDCSYLCIELKYINDIIESYFLCNPNNDDITLEFDK